MEKKKMHIKPIKKVKLFPYTPRPNTKRADDVLPNIIVIFFRCIESFHKKKRHQKSSARMTPAPHIKLV
jgi:hypothetical protein